MCVVPPQTDGLCSSDGVIIQTVTAEPTSSDPLDQSQLAVDTEGRGLDDRLEATSLLEGSDGVVTETQEPMTDDFTDKVQTRADFLQLHKTRAFNLKNPVFGQFVHLFLCVSGAELLLCGGSSGAFWDNAWQRRADRVASQHQQHTDR